MKKESMEKSEIKEEGMKDLVETVQERRLDAIPYIMDKLEIEPSSLPEDYHQVEGVVKGLWVRDRREDPGKEKEKYTEIINAVAELFKDTDKNNIEFQGWSHSLCHLFETYDPVHLLYSRSLLQPRHLKTAEKLVNECVYRGLKVNKIGCMNRIIYPIIKYNLYNIKTKEDLDRYDFKPESLLDPSKELIKLFGKKEEDVSDFLTTRTSKEYILKQMARKQRLFSESEYEEGAKKTIEILNLIKEYISEEETNSYLKSTYNISVRDIGGKNIAETLRIMKENVEKSKKASEESEEAKGVFVDVEGTLVIGGKLNEEILKEIEENSKKGKDIIIFTGGDPEKQTEFLRKLGFPEKFLPVKDKKGYKGKTLEKLIDDTEPAFQGFQCRSFRRVLQPKT